MTALLEEAIAAIGANRLRSALTMLGIVIGVASVILMLAIGEGSRRRVAQSIASLGSQQLIVMSGAPSSGGLRGAAGALPTLTLDDAQAIGELGSVRAVAPVASVAVQAVHGGNNVATSVTGTLPAWFAINHWKLAAGRVFDAAEARSAASVAVLGATVARELFGDAPAAIGATLRIQRQTVEVIGVLAPKGQGFGGQDQDDVIVLPVATAQRRLAGSVFPGSVSLIVVEAAHDERKLYAQDEITRLLRQRHRMAPGAEDDFSVRDMSALADTLALTSRILSVLLGAIAVISLVVGGIGIMNIMLVSVTERTREIGLRMALGARRAGVRAQFLVEAAILSVLGALLGLAIGLGVGWLASRTGAVTPVYSAGAAALAMGLAIAVGIGFGWWPAHRAAALEPVEALRHG